MCPPPELMSARKQCTAVLFQCCNPNVHAAWLQIAGFAAVFALFLACGLAFQPLTSSTGMLNLFQALYYISSFFAQFVNATTFLLVGFRFRPSTA